MVDHFTTPLEVTPSPELGCFVTTRPFGFDVGFKGSGLTVNVPAGFPTDFASVPSFLWWLFPRDDPHYAAAAVLHDFLYCWRSDAGERFDRSTADAIFLEAMGILGVATWRRWAMYLAVRIFGRAYWARG